MKKQIISIVVPVFNEEETLNAFYGACMDAIKEADFEVEIIFVNDGSRDQSLSLIRELSKKDARVRGIDFSRNFGSYAAIEAGFAHARGDAVMAISCDLQDPPSLIREFVPAWRNGAETVWGVRSGRDDPFFKAIYARMFYCFIKRFIWSDFPNDGMDCGLFDRKIIDEYLRIKDRNSIPFFTIYEMGFVQERIPYKRGARLAGESGWPFWKRVKCALDIAVGFSYLPIRLSILAGAFCAACAFAYGSVIVLLKVFFDTGSPGWSSLAVLILFLGGLQLIFTGVVAEYVWRISDKVKGKPIFLIREIIGNEVD